MLVCWLPKTADTIPANSSHRVGVGALVMNSKREVCLLDYFLAFPYHYIKKEALIWELWFCSCFPNSYYIYIYIYIYDLKCQTVIMIVVIRKEYNMDQMIGFIFHNQRKVLVTSMVDLKRT